jgi:hypothetical protein
VAPAKGVAQLWRVDLGGKGGKGGSDSTQLDLAKHAPAVQVSHSVLDLGGYKLSPDGKQVLLSYEVFTDCATWRAPSSASRRATRTRPAARL